MADIARHLKLSTSTVSRALSRHPSIPEKTRLRVEKTASALGYRPDPMMSQIAARRWSRTSAEPRACMAYIVLGAKVNRRTPHWKGAQRGAASLGYRLEGFSVENMDASNHLCRILRARGIRGIIFRHATASARLPDWDWSAYSVICCGEPPAEHPPMHTVELAITDNHQRLARECLARGIKRPGLLFAATPWLRSEHRRLGGLTTPFLEAGLAPPPFRWWNEESATEISKWLTKVKADAVITMLVPQALKLRDANIIGQKGLPYGCMQLNPDDPREIAGVCSNFSGVARWRRASVK